MGATMVKPLVKNGNLLDALPSQGTLHVVMLGLDSAGKTTALYRLKFDQYLNTVPTIGFNCEKVQGTIGKAKGVHFLVWDVGGQEKLRPLWRSYTRCTDGILFVIDSVDTERMEEAKMELMRTAKCPDNQVNLKSKLFVFLKGVPVLILANKQDLPSACGAIELEKLLGLNELHNYSMPPNISVLNSCSSSSSTSNLINCSMSHQSITESSLSVNYNPNINNQSNEKNAAAFIQYTHYNESEEETKKYCKNIKQTNYNGTVSNTTFRGWYIQPTCAITGEGLQEGLDALYDMILKRRKINKSYRKRRLNGFWAKY